MSDEQLLTSILKEYFELLDKRVITVLKKCNCISQTQLLTFENCKFYYTSYPLKIFDIIDIVAPLIIDKETDNKILEKLKSNIDRESPLNSLISSNVIIKKDTKFNKLKTMVINITKLTLIEMMIKRNGKNIKCLKKIDDNESSPLDILKHLLVEEYLQRQLKKNI